MCWKFELGIHCVVWNLLLLKTIENNSFLHVIAKKKVNKRCNSDVNYYLIKRVIK